VTNEEKTLTIGPREEVRLHKLQKRHKVLWGGEVACWGNGRAKEKGETPKRCRLIKRKKRDMSHELGGEGTL